MDPGQSERHRGNFRLFGREQLKPVLHYPRRRIIRRFYRQDQPAGRAGQYGGAQPSVSENLEDSGLFCILDHDVVYLFWKKFYPLLGRGGVWGFLLCGPADYAAGHGIPDTGARAGYCQGKEPA